MNNKRIQRLLTAIVVIVSWFALADAAIAKGKANHHDGKQLLGENIKTNGNHVIHRKGAYTASAEVKDGKIAGVHVKHAKNGDVPVKKYKTNKNMAQAAAHQFTSMLLTQDQYIGTVWIGYAYIDEYGDETIYWFPYDMILDGITGAVDYVPAY
jgi:hypothetical protein